VLSDFAVNAVIPPSALEMDLSAYFGSVGSKVVCGNGGGEKRKGEKKWGRLI
jgi:hypothetical protein